MPSCVMSHFFEVARAFPDRVAISEGDEKLTYSELDIRSRKLAMRISYLASQAEFVVGVSLKPSIELIVCVLAIWRAGGTYLPLDPEYPRKRLRYMLVDSGCRIVLTATQYAETFQNSEITTWCIDQSIGLENGRSVEPVYQNHGATSELAYIVYTSGSTGQPKGVEGTHRSLINRLSWGLDAFPVTSDDVCCLKTSISFVDSLSEMLTPILGGCLLKIVPSALINKPVELVQFLREEGVTRFVAVPSLLKLISAVLVEKGETLADMTVVVSSGETLSSATAIAVLSTMPNTFLVNLYGASEIGADVTCNVLTQMSDITGDISIGWPAADAVCVVLDDAGRPVDDNVSGELYVGGACLARGYRNNDMETRTRFVKPAEELCLSCERLFRTGDLVKRLHDGSFLFLGRADDQINIGGVRIELCEIESAIFSSGIVREVAVAALERTEEDRYLAAFVVMDDDDESGSSRRIEQLRSYLSATLPPVMLPTHFEVISALPLNLNGKLDRRALRRGLGQMPLATYPAQPNASTLKKLAQVWADTLELDPEVIQAGSDFKLLGGNSFALLKLVFRCSNIWQSPLDIPQFLVNPTLGAMAMQLEACEANDAPMRSRGNDIISAPLSPSQRRLLNGIQTSAPRICHHNIEFLYEVETDLETLGTALSRFLERHDVFRITSFRLDFDDQLIQEFDSSEPEFSVTVHGNDVAVNDFVRKVKEYRDAINPHDGRLYYFHLCSDTTGTTYLYGLINHLIFDGYSQFLMLSELSNFIVEPERPLPKPLGFGDRCLIYRNGSARAYFAREVSYWASIVETAPEQVTLSDKRGEGESHLSVTDCVLLDKRGLLKERSVWFRSNIALAMCAFAVGHRFGLLNLGARIVGSNRLARDDVNDSLTVGYVSDHYPQKLVIGKSLSDTISILMEARSTVPSGGAGYPWLRHVFQVPELVNGAQLDEFPMHFNFLPRPDDHPLFTERTDFLGPPDPFQGDDDYQGIAFFVREGDSCLRVGIYRNSRFVSDATVNAILEILETNFEHLSDICPSLGDLESKKAGDTPHNK